VENTDGNTLSHLPPVNNTWAVMFVRKIRGKINISSKHHIFFFFFFFSNAAFFWIPFVYVLPLFLSLVVNTRIKTNKRKSFTQKREILTTNWTKWLSVADTCKWLPEKTRAWNELLRVERDVKPYSLTHSRKQRINNVKTAAVSMRQRCRNFHCNWFNDTRTRFIN